MNLMKITAIFNESLLSKVEEKLVSHGVKGFTVYSVKGRGNYYNSYSKNHFVTLTQLEIYTREKFVTPIRNLLIQTADIGIHAEGLLAVTEVNELIWIYQNTPAKDTDFNYNEVKHD